MARSSSTGPQPPRPAAGQKPLPSAAEHGPSPSAAQAAGWLTSQLSAERASMNKQMETRQRELNKQMETRHNELVQQFKLMMATSNAAQDGPAKRAEKQSGHTEGASNTECASNLVLAVAERHAPPAEKEKAEGTVEGLPLPFESETSGRPPVRMKSSRTTIPGELNAWEARGRLSRIVTSSKFEITFCVLIVLNSMVMAIEVQYEGDTTAHMLGYRGAIPADKAWPGATSAFHVLDLFFGLIFSFEVFTKLVVLHRRFIQHTWWNLFDLVVMAVWLLNQLLMSTLPLDPTLWRVARFAKLARLLRALKLVKAVHPLILMVKAISASVSILCWSMLLLAMMVSILAIIMCVLLEPWIRDESIDLEQRIMLFQSWGSFSRAFASMSEITLDDFGPRLRELQDIVAEYWGAVVLLYRFTIGFAVVQVVTSVFIQQTFNVAWIDEEVMIRDKTRAAQSYANHLGKLFEFLDESGDGMISKEEFLVALGDERVERWFHALELDASDVRELFDMLAGEDGEIDREEFMNGLKILHGKAKTSSMIILFDGLRKKMNAMSDKVDMLSGEIQLNRLATAQPPLCQDASQPTESSPVELGDKDRSRTRSLKSSDATSCPPDRDNKSAIDASDVGLIELGGVPSFGQMAQDAKAAPHVPGPKSEPKSDPDETPRRRAYRLASVKSMKIQEPAGESGQEPARDSI